MTNTTILNEKKERLFYLLCILNEFFSRDTAARNEYLESANFYREYDIQISRYAELFSICIVHFPNLLPTLHEFRGAISCFRGYFNNYIFHRKSGSNESVEQQCMNKVHESVVDLNRCLNLFVSKLG